MGTGTTNAAPDMSSRFGRRRLLRGALPVVFGLLCTAAAAPPDISARADGSLSLRAEPGAAIRVAAARLLVADAQHDVLVLLAAQSALLRQRGVQGVPDVQPATGTTPPPASTDEAFVYSDDNSGDLVVLAPQQHNGTVRVTGLLALNDLGDVTAAIARFAALAATADRVLASCNSSSTTSTTPTPPPATTTSAPPSDDAATEIFVNEDNALVLRAPLVLCASPLVVAGVDVGRVLARQLVLMQAAVAEVAAACVVCPAKPRYCTRQNPVTCACTECGQYAYLVPDGSQCVPGHQCPPGTFAFNDLTGSTGFRCVQPGFHCDTSVDPQATPSACKSCLVAGCAQCRVDGPTLDDITCLVSTDPEAGAGRAEPCGVGTSCRAGLTCGQFAADDWRCCSTLVAGNLNLACASLQAGDACFATAQCDGASSYCLAGQCRHVTSGSLADGAACAADVNCAAGRTCALHSDDANRRCCSSTTTTEDSAVLCADLAPGDACRASAQCAGSAVCVGGVCQEVAAGSRTQMQPCAADADCAASLVCAIYGSLSDRRCCASPSPEQPDVCVDLPAGATCLLTEQCAAGLYCGAGQCREPVAGTRTHGQPCDTDGSCADTLRCGIFGDVSASFCCASLIPGTTLCSELADGDACLGNQCKAPLECVLGICSAPRGDVGATCAGDDDCLGGLRCRPWTATSHRCCASTVGADDFCQIPPGGPCSHHEQCQHAGHYCAPGSGTCEAQVAGGVECLVDAQCSGDMPCRLWDNTTRRCCPEPLDDSFCSVQLAEPCALDDQCADAGGYCSPQNHTCVARRERGAACTTSSECASGVCGQWQAGTRRCCASGTDDLCHLHTDEPCFDHQQCQPADGFCNATTAVCQPQKLQRGINCTEDDECAGGVCALWTAAGPRRCCATRVGRHCELTLGEPCAVHESCLANQSYCKGHCFARKAAMSACDHSAECVSGQCGPAGNDTVCCPDSYVNQTSGELLCSDLPVGASCAFAAQCKDQLHCTLGRCTAPKKARGAACTADDECQSGACAGWASTSTKRCCGARVSDAHCVVGLREPCALSVQCVDPNAAAGLYCDANNVCQLQADHGSACSHSAMCQSNLCLPRVPGGDTICCGHAYNDSLCTSSLDEPCVVTAQARHALHHAALGLTNCFPFLFFFLFFDS